jgi:hypothetical protein
MPTLERQSERGRGINWRAIVATLLVQVLVLIALSVAAVAYVNWSSEAALAEFVGVFRPLTSDQARRFSSPLQPVKGRTSCVRRA